MAVESKFDPKDMEYDRPFENCHVRLLTASTGSATLVLAD